MKQKNSKPNSIYFYYLIRPKKCWYKFNLNHDNLKQHNWVHLDIYLKMKLNDFSLYYGFYFNSSLFDTIKNILLVSWKFNRQMLSCGNNLPDVLRKNSFENRRCDNKIIYSLHKISLEFNLYLVLCIILKNFPWFFTNYY